MWGKIISILNSAIVSNISNVINKFVDFWLNKRGNLDIYVKLVYLKNCHDMAPGVYCDNYDVFLIVPMWIEIVNLKKSSIIIRDFSLYLYKNGVKIKRMKQISHVKNEDSSIDYYGDEGKYSFYIEPENTKRYNLLYDMKKSMCNEDFDEIKIVYYVANNKRIVKEFKTINDSWKLKKIDIDEEWVKL